MLKERTKLEEELAVVLSKYAINQKIIDGVEDLFMSKGINGSDARDILTKRVDISILTDTILYLLTKGLYDTMKASSDFPANKNNINPTKWFAKAEIEQYDKYEEIKEDSVGFPLIFENIRQKMQDYYIADDVPIQTLVKWLESRVIRYNPKTQRKTKLREQKGVIIEQIDVDKDQVKEITESILKGEQFPNFLILNVLRNENEEIQFTKKKQTDLLGKLIVKSGEIDALDGFHRMIASLHALQINPNLEFSWGIIIVNYDESKARRFMVQEQKGRKMDTGYVKSLDINRLENLTVKKINDNQEIDIYNKIVPTDDDIRIGRGWTKFSIMEDAILDVFGDELQSKFDTNGIADKICQGLNEIIGANIEQFNNRDNVKTSVINHKNIYPAYIYLTKKVIDLPNWKDKIFDAINKIDFSTSNEKWTEIGVISHNNMDINKLARTRLYNFIDEKLEEIL